MRIVFLHADLIQPSELLAIELPGLVSAANRRNELLSQIGRHIQSFHFVGWHH